MYAIIHTFTRHNLLTLNELSSIRRECALFCTAKLAIISLITKLFCA